DSRTARQRMVAMRAAPLMPARNPCLWGSRASSRPGTKHRAGPRRIQPGPPRPSLMSASDQTSRTASPGHWIADQAYLLLCITALCWAGNAIVGRLAAGNIPPVTLSFLRWSIAFLIMLPFAWKHLVRDWPAIRGKLGLMILVSITGIGVFNTLQYWALEHTQAL